MFTFRKIGAALATTALATTLAAAGASTAEAAPREDARTVAAKTVAADTGAAAKMQLLGDSYAYLAIRSIGGGNYSVLITGHAHLTQALPSNIFFRLYGDDTWADDVLYRTPSYSTDVNGNFWVQFTVKGAVLNEDWGGDEIYAKAVTWDPSNGLAEIPTNVVSGSY